MKLYSVKKIVAILAISLISPGLLAIEYSSENELKVTSQYDDNARLSYDNVINLFGYSVRPKVDWQAKEEHWDVKAELDVHFNKYDLEEWNSDDQYLTVAGNYRTERQNVGLSTSAIKDTTRTSEFDTSGQIGFSAEKRERITVTPSWTYMLTDRNQLSLQVSSSNTEYDSNDYTDYKYLSGQGGWTHIFDEAIRITFNVTYSDFKPEFRGPYTIGLPGSGLPPFSGITANRTKSVGYLLGGEYVFTEKTSLTANIGSTESDSKYTLIEIPNGIVDCQLYEDFGQSLPACNVADYNSSDLAGDISLNYSGERNSLKLSASLQHQPASYGYVMQYYRVNINWTYRLSAKARLRSYLGGGQNEALDKEISTIDSRYIRRDFASASLRYDYQFLENWYLNTAANYRWQEYETSPGDASSSGVTLGITYKPTKKLW